MPETETTALAVIPSPVESAVELLRARPDFDVGKLRELLELQERYESRRAAEAFAAALTNFQAECPIVQKGRQAGQEGKDFGYTYAGFDDVMRTARPLLSKNHIVVTFSTELITRKDDEAREVTSGMKGTCRVRVGTHFEETTLTIPIPAMKVSDTQKAGAAVSYLKRYLLCAALNIVTSNEDDDAAYQWEAITEEEAFRLNELIVEKGVSPPLFLTWVSSKAKTTIANLSDMPRDLVAEAMDYLTRKKPPLKGATP